MITESAPRPPPCCYATENIFKPANDLRNYRGLKLTNGMSAMAIHDDNTDMAAVALSVNVGSLSDPLDRQGLAHLVERMLPIASAKYPQTNGFKQFIESNGGRVFNRTTMTKMSFIYEINARLLEQSLDRFASIFIEPLWKESELARELDHIQSNFEKMKQIQVYRDFRIRQILSEPNHDFSKFSCGTKQTLLHDEDQNATKELMFRLESFVKNLFSSHIMTVAVVGPQPLNVLQQMITDNFIRVPRNSVTRLRIENHPYPPSRCRKLVRIVPAQETRKLVMFFPLPARISGNATSYIRHILQHRGPGSLFSQLKARGYTTWMAVQIQYYCGFGFLDISMDLTQGITCNKQITDLLYQFLNLLKSFAPSKRIYNELKALHEMSFHFMEPLTPWDLVSFVSESMIGNEMEYAVCGQPYDQFNPTDIRNVLACLNPRQFNVHVISPIFKELIQEPKYDRLFGIFYEVTDIDDKQWDKLEPNLEFDLPEENPFVPTNFRLLPVKVVNKPERIESQKLGIVVWHMPFCSLPKAMYRFYIRSPVINMCAEHEVAVEVFIRLFREHLLEKFYSATLCDVQTDVWLTRFGIEIRVYGFNDKLDTIAVEVLSELLKFNACKGRFEIIREVYANEIRCYNETSVCNVLQTTLKTIMNPGKAEHSKCFKAVNELKRVEQIYQLIEKVLVHFQLEVTVIGNVELEDAQHIARTLDEMLDVYLGAKFQKNAPNCSPIKDFLLPTPSFFEMVHRDEFHENNGILYYYQIGQDHDDLRYTQFKLWLHIISPYFDKLTKKDDLLGCDIQLLLRETWTGTFGLELSIETNKPLNVIVEKLENIINNKLDEQLTKELKTESFEKHKANLLIRLRQAGKTLSDQSYQLAREIGSQAHIWGWAEKQIARMAEITADQIMQLYRSHIKTSGESCRRIVLKLISAKRKGEDESPAPPHTGRTATKYIPNISRFQLDLSLLNSECLK